MPSPIWNPSMFRILLHRNDFPDFGGPIIHTTAIGWSICYKKLVASSDISKLSYSILIKGIDFIYSGILFLRFSIVSNKWKKE